MLSATWMRLAPLTAAWCILVHCSMQPSDFGAAFPEFDAPRQMEVFSRDATCMMQLQTHHGAPLEITLLGFGLF